MTDQRGNRNRYVFQSLFMAAAISVADTSAVLPLIIDYFNGSEILIGILSSLMKGGVVIMQLWTAFKAQSQKLVLRSLRKVFIFRFFTWFFVGLSILFFAGYNEILVLFLISLFLFLFSFSAGVGVIYYQELLGKCFSKEYRGKTIALKQIAAGLAGIISGGISALILKSFQQPESFSYLFFVSSLFLAISYAVFWNFKEEVKIETSERENNFHLFLKNAYQILKNDKSLIIQILTRFLAFGFLIILPFIILQAKSNVGLTPVQIGIIISMQPSGAVTGNFLWAFLAQRNRNKCIIIISFCLIIISVSGSFFASEIWYYYIVYFMFGAAIDGFRLAFNNLILIIAPAKKRPVYIAVQNNLSSFGLFFAIPGGMILRHFNFNVLSYITLFIMILGVIFTVFLKKE